MSEPGVFKTKIFGGFDKKDVFNYFEAMKAESSEDTKFIFQKNEELLNKNKELLDKLDEKDFKIEELTRKNAELKKQLDENDKKFSLIEHLKADNDTLSKHVASLEAELFSLNQKIEADGTYKSRCDMLTRKVLKAQSEAVTIKSRLQKELSKIEALSVAIRSIPDIDGDELLNCVAVINSFTVKIEELAALQHKIEAVKSKLED